MPIHAVFLMCGLSKIAASFMVRRASATICPNKKTYPFKWSIGLIFLGKRGVFHTFSTETLQSTPLSTGHLLLLLVLLLLHLIWCSLDGTAHKNRPA